MAVNQNVYSNKNNWISYKPTSSITYVKIPSYQNLIAGINQNFIEENSELDKSITTVQCDSGFSGGIINLARGSGVNNFDEKYMLKDILSEFDIKNISIFKPNDNNESVINVNNFNLSTLAPNITLKANDHQTTSPILTFGKNSNIKLLIGIVHNNDATSRSYTFNSLDDFISSGDKYVYGVYAIPMFLNPNNNNYNIYDNDAYSFSYQFLNYPTKTFDFYKSTNLLIKSKFYSLLRKTEKSKYLAPYNDRTSLLFPIFSNTDSTETLWGNYNYYYYFSTGFIPSFTNSELELNEKISENGVTIEKFFRTNTTNEDYYSIKRYIDLTLTDYWGSDNTKFIEWCKKQTAYFGMFFTTSYSNKDKGLTDSTTYLGIIDDDGVTHGEYTQGSENSEQKNFDVDIISEIEKTPPEKIQKDKGDLTSNINPFRYKSPNQLFILTETDLNDLFTFINIGYRPNEENFILDFKGKNPIDYIVSVNVFPFDIPAIAPNEIDLTIGGIPVKKSPFLETAETVTVKQLGLGSEFVQPIFDFGSVSINPYFNDFRDYEPFTRCEIQLPYCGTYTVDLKKFMNKNLSVKYVVDYNTGACTALIFMNDLLIDTVDGQIGFSIPLSGIAQGEYQNTIQRNSYNAKIAGYDIVKSGINQISNVLTGNLKGAANSTVNSLSAIETGLQANYELSHTAPQPTILSTADTLNSFCQDNRVRVLFYRCEIPRYDEEVFKKTVGYACIKSGKVSDFTGLMICSNVKLDNINCTDTEKNILKNLLTSGVYN